MADFTQLKQMRKTKEGRSSALKLPVTASVSSSTSQQQQEPEAVETEEYPTTGPIPYKSEGLYASLPPTLDIRVNKNEGGNGRGIYSQYRRNPGDILFSIKPHVASLSNEHLEQYCSNCFGPGNGELRRCTGCKILHYCDAACQKADWPLHKQECSAIQRWSAPTSGSSTIPGDAIRGLARILWRKQKLGKGSIWAREVDAMESHRTSLSKDPDSRDSQLYTQLAHAIVRFLDLNSPQDMASYGLDSAADLVDLVSRFTTNTFTISTPALAPLGACVSPLVALINHSCDPNAVVVFPRAGGESAKDQEPLMQVIALKPIAPDEEILTAYIDTTHPPEIRQKMLRETYHFTCHCRLCAPPPNSPVDLRQAIFCPKKCGGVCPLPTEETSLTRCSTCKTPVKDTDAVLDAVRVGQEALDKAEALQFSNVEKSIQLTTKLIPILISAGLVPSAHPLLALSRLNSSLLIAQLSSNLDTSSGRDPSIEEVLSPGVQASQHSSPEEETQVPPTPTPTTKGAQEALDDAIRAATRTSTGLSLILVEGHPMRGIALAELGKLLNVDEPCPIVAAAASPSPESRPTLAKPPAYPPSGPPRLKMAYETLLRARAELSIGFGAGKNEGGEVGRGVRALAVLVEKELTVWKDGVRNVLEDETRRGSRK